MHIGHTRKAVREHEDLNERQRREVMRGLEQYGAQPAAGLTEMNEAERAKWLFWNLHENLDTLRKLEPALVGQVIRTQMTVSDGESMWTQGVGLERRLELSCKWQLMLKDQACLSEESYPLTDGWVELYVGDRPPPHPALQDNQKAYLDADSPLYPNQLFLYGWITEGVWDEIKPQVTNASANCHTDIFIRDNFMFPVKPMHPFVSGPAGSIGMINLEFRVSTQPRLTSWIKP